MPITEKGFEYTMPDMYKAMVTKSFLQTLKYELKIIFSVNRMAEGLLFNNEEDWINLSSTGSWSDAFSFAAELHDLYDLLLYYQMLPWYDSDMFDSDLIDLALFYNVIDPIVEPTWSERVYGHIQHGWWTFRIHVDNFINRFKHV